MARVIGHGDINLERGVRKVAGVDAILGINRCGDGCRLIEVIEIDARGTGDDRHAGEVCIVRRSLSRLLLGRSAPKRAFGGTAGGNSLLVRGHGFINVRIIGRSVRVRRGSAVGVIDRRIGNECHESRRAARRGGLGARHGACRGGDIIFVVDDHLTTLMDFRYKRKYVAPEGGKGGASLCHGKNAENLVIKVPLGTVIKDAESGLVIADLSDHTPVTIAKGGRGGYGNAHFATPTRQIPKFAKPGMPGEDIQVTLELKLIADVGLIGFPNVGKSTLISTISAAKPKIANYHFTTLVPTLGVVSVAEGASFVCADIPGLIEGASEGIGLGHDFLRHVERCRLLLHVVDVSGSECREPIEDFEKINEELAKFSPVLAERPQIVIGNKCDLATEEQIEAFRKYVEGKGLTFVPISAATMQGVKELPGLVYNRLKDIPPVPVFAPEYKKPEPKANDRAFEIKRMEAHVWSVEAPWLEYILAGSNVDDYESLQFFQRQLGESGILDALVAKGVQENDTILIGDYQFDYIF